MNKKVQKSKKSILAMSVLSLFALTTLGFGAASLAPTNVYAAGGKPTTEGTPPAVITTSIKDASSVTGAEHSGKVAYGEIGGTGYKVTYSVETTEAINGLQFDIGYFYGSTITAININSSIANDATVTPVTEDTKSYTFIWGWCWNRNSILINRC